MPFRLVTMVPDVSATTNPHGWLEKVGVCAVETAGPSALEPPA